MHAPLHKLPALPSPQRSRSRRERRSGAARKPVVHVVMPGMEVARAEPRPRETISAFLRRNGWATKDRTYGWQFKKGLPTVLEVNGEPVLRRFWTTTRIAANDNVRFVSFPLGGQGGAKQVIGLVALVAVSAFALWVPGALGLAAGSFAAYATTAAVGLGGALLINALVAPKAGATNAPDATQDQIYSVGAQGNTAKLGQPLPVWYGRLKTFPDFAATPWGEFVGNDQYLNVLLSVGMGSFEYETLFIDDTPLWTTAGGIEAAYPTAQVAFYEPGETVSLFAVNVDSSSEVSGQQLPDGAGTYGGEYTPAVAQTPGAYLGGFIANPAGTLAQAIAVDFVLPAGCFTADQNGNNIGGANIILTAEYRPVNDAGAPTGSYTELFHYAKAFATTSPIRDSVKVDVTPGRYQVRFRRDDAGLTSTKGSNSVVWAGLRSFLKGDSSFADVSTIAIRIKASESTQGSYKFGVLATRKVPVWTGSSFVTQASRNPGWSFLDAVSSAQYGPDLSLTKVDFNAIVNFAAGCDTRGDTFDYAFTTAVVVPEALDKILTPARARHFWLGDTISVVRDEWRDVPAMLLTDREIVRDSTQITFTMLGDEDPDAVIVEYLDEDTWGPAQVQYPPDGEFFTATNAEVKRIDGVINRDQAYRECAFYYLQSIYRRENVQIGTEYEGRAITFGSVLRVQSELPMAYGQGGAVTAVTGHTLTLNPAPVWSDGPFYVRLRRPNGKWFGPVGTTMGGTAATAVLNDSDLASVQSSQGITLDEVLEREDGGEYPSFEFGTADSQSKLCVVLNGVPNGNTCTLNLVVDDIRVHATDLGSPPVLPTTQFPTNDKLPFIIGLNATFGQGTAEPKLEASWFPSPGAVYYIADVSYDAGESWTQVYEGQDNKLSQVVTLAALRLRVQAVTLSIRGPYATIDLDAPTIVIADGLVALSSLSAGIVDQVAAIAAYNDKPLSEIVDTIAAFVANQDARNWLDKSEVRSQLSSRSEAAFAEIEHVSTVSTAADAALASDILTVSTGLGAANTQIALNATAISDLSTSFGSYQTSVTASFGAVNSAVTANSSAIATINGYAAAQYSVTLDVNGYATGFNLLNGGAGISAAIFISDKFQVAFPSLGYGPTDVFTIANVNGASKIALLGDMIVDGSITTQKILAGEVKTINLDAQAVTAAKIQTGSITSASGVIGALGVQSLSIGDNAVTVTDAAVLTSAYSFGFSGSPQTILSKTLNVDTAGLSGKPMNMLLQFTGQTTTSNANISSQIKANGATLSNNVVTNSGVIVLSGMYSFTGTGGVVSISASLVSQANSPGGPFVANVNDGTLSAVVAKR